MSVIRSMQTFLSDYSPSLMDSDAESVIQEANICLGKNQLPLIASQNDKRSKSIWDNTTYDQIAEKLRDRIVLVSGKMGLILVDDNKRVPSKSRIAQVEVTIELIEHLIHHRFFSDMYILVDGKFLLIVPHYLGSKIAVLR
jgi:hypothetical protein